jgi:hypothetical protein
MESTWAFANANGCSGSWSFASVSHGRCWQRRIRRGRRSIKKPRKLMKDNTVDLWALDEVHFQQQGRGAFGASTELTRLYFLKVTQADHRLGVPVELRLGISVARNG